MEEIDLNDTFTEDEVQDLADWVESLTLSDLKELREYWEDKSRSITPHGKTVN